MAAFKIMREAGPAARRRARAPWSYAAPKKVGVSEGPDQRAALEAFVAARYPAGHRQFVSVGYVGRRGDVKAIVTLANGANVHTLTLLAWEAS